MLWIPASAWSDVMMCDVCRVLCVVPWYVTCVCVCVCVVMC